MKRIEIVNMLQELIDQKKVNKAELEKVIEAIRPKVAEKKEDTTRKYHFTKVDLGSKIPPQMEECLKIGLENDGKTEDELKEVFAKCGERLKTRQDPWRIFAYYRPRLVAAKACKWEEVKATA